MIEVTFLLSIIFFATVIGFAVEYYKHLAKVKKEYEEAKVSFNDIVLSFSRELKRITESMRTFTYKIEAATARGTETSSKVEAMEGKLKNLENRVGKVLENWDNLLVQLEEIKKQAYDVVTSHKELAARITLLEEKLKQTPTPSESGVETVIPIRKERALAHLTETELAVLEMLAAEGPKTAPEIKEKIKLSREHTARLMKKLYEEGYLERDSSKIPFKYNVKKEMEKLLRRTEQL